MRLSPNRRTKAYWACAGLGPTSALVRRFSMPAATSDPAQNSPGKVRGTVQTPRANRRHGPSSCAGVSQTYVRSGEHSLIATANPTILTKVKEDLRPLHDRVVVKRIDAEEKTAGGIIIPDSAKEKPSQGEVIAVGPGGRDEAAKLIPIDVKVGDRVLFGKWSGTEVKIEARSF